MEAVLGSSRGTALTAALNVHCQTIQIRSARLQPSPSGLNTAVHADRTSRKSLGWSKSCFGEASAGLTSRNGRSVSRKPFKATVSELPPQGVAEAPLPIPVNDKPKSSDETIQSFLTRDYKWGFTTDIKSKSIPKGLSEETVRIISAKKDEPEWMLEFRLSAYRQWLKMKEPVWSDNQYPAIDYQVRTCLSLLSLLSLIPLFSPLMRKP